MPIRIVPSPPRRWVPIRTGIRRGKLLTLFLLVLFFLLLYHRIHLIQYLLKWLLTASRTVHFSSTVTRTLVHYVHQNFKYEGIDYATSPRRELQLETQFISSNSSINLPPSPVIDRFAASRFSYCRRFSRSVRSTTCRSTSKTLCSTHIRNRFHTHMQVLSDLQPRSANFSAIKRSCLERSLSSFDLIHERCCCFCSSQLIFEDSAFFSDFDSFAWELHLQHIRIELLFMFNRSFCYLLPPRRRPATQRCRWRFKTLTFVSQIYDVSVLTFVVFQIFDPPKNPIRLEIRNRPTLNAFRGALFMWFLWIWADYFQK